MNKRINDEQTIKKEKMDLSKKKLHEMGLMGNIEDLP